ncbi:MAG: polysaccharide deacetylase [Pseudomonadota bacterium]
MIQHPVTWPNGARCAAAITFDMDADSLLHIEHPKTSLSKISAMSMLRYGPEVGVPRILEGYRKYGLKQTFFIPAWCIEQYPKTVEAIVEGGHEIGFHGYIHEAPNSLSREDERYWLERSIEVIERFTGKRPRGNRSPLYHFSDNTADLLIEQGFLYDSSLMGDDIPYLLQTADGELVELPTHWGVDDWPPYVHSLELDYVMQVMSPARAMEGFREEFEAAYEAGGLWIGVWHPFVSGRLARWRQVEKLIDDMVGRGDVWLAPLEDIARHVLASRESCQLRVDRLPYYDRPVMPIKR